jgi:hypothetical protein
LCWYCCCYSGCCCCCCWYWSCCCYCCYCACGCRRRRRGGGYGCRRGFRVKGRAAWWPRFAGRGGRRGPVCVCVCVVCVLCVCVVCVCPCLRVRFVGFLRVGYLVGGWWCLNQCSNLVVAGRSSESPIRIEPPPSHSTPRPPQRHRTTTTLSVHSGAKNNYLGRRREHRAAALGDAGLLPGDGL